MTATTLKKELSIYLPLLSARQQALILDMIKSILHVDSKEKRISVEQYNAEIESALKEVRQGKIISHDEVVKQSRKWLKRR
jgi:Fe2+ transport system protein B